MQLLALVSGGKDSVTAASVAHALGHQIVAAATITAHDTVELDSHMFQTVALDIVQAMAKDCIRLPHYHKNLEKSQSSQTPGSALAYSQKEDEIEVLFELVREVLEKHPNINGVITGAILSNYQRLRVENICKRLGLVSFAPLWRIPQNELLEAMIECGIDAVLVKAAVFGLNPRNVLGKSISELKEQLLMIGNPCGEGGEFETITLDSPLFKEEKIELKSYSIVGDRLDNEWDPCGNFQIETFDVVKKLSPAKEVSFQILRDLVIQKCIFLNNNHAQSHSIGSKMFPRFSIIPEGRKTFVFYHTTRSGISFSVAPEKCDSIQNMLNSWNISERGLVIKDALTIALYVPSMKEFGSLNKLYNEYFDVDPPSRCCVEIPSSFFYGDCVYISKFWTKTSLHVQSISSWAPACIGPYSQATQCFVSEKSKLSFLAGQIPLVPITMQIDAKSVEEELQLTLLHAGSILDALKSAYAQSCKSLKDLKFEEVLLSIIFSTVETFESVCSSMDELSETYNWPPSLVLSVTALPRNSRVETQILTNSLSESLGWRLESNHTEFCEFKICSESIRISNSGLSSSFYMPFNFGSCVSISLNEILDALIGSCNVDDDCAIVRLYYDCSVIEDVDAFECLVRNRMVGIAVSFFPCMGVYFKGCFTPVLVYCLRVPPRSDDADVIY